MVDLSNFPTSEVSTSVGNPYANQLAPLQPSGADQMKQIDGVLTLINKATPLVEKVLDRFGKSNFSTKPQREVKPPTTADIINGTWDESYDPPAKLPANAKIVPQVQQNVAEVEEEQSQAPVTPPSNSLPESATKEEEQPKQLQFTDQDQANCLSGWLVWIMKNRKENPTIEELAFLLRQEIGVTYVKRLQTITKAFIQEGVKPENPTFKKEGLDKVLSSANIEEMEAKENGSGTDK